jgi:hypothetical protein
VHFTAYPIFATLVFCCVHKALPMADRPTGTGTFLFTDIESSTKLAQALLL